MGCDDAESIQWNWKCFSPPSIATPMLDESIQWNWKRFRLSSRGTMPGPGNPFNGIERQAELPTELWNSDTRWIHSMELKAGGRERGWELWRGNPFNGIERHYSVTTSAKSSSRSMNPFNGIERLLAITDTHQDNYKNPFNGIESIYYRRRVHYRSQRGIHSMELKVNIYVSFR